MYVTNLKLLENYRQFPTMQLIPSSAPSKKKNCLK